MQPKALYTASKNPAGYSQLLAQIKAEVHAGRARVARAVNTEGIEQLTILGSADA